LILYSQGREIGKAVRHAPILEVVDNDLKQYFIDLDNLLSDTGHLISDNNAKLARKRLSEVCKSYICFFSNILEHIRLEQVRSHYIISTKFMFRFVYDEIHVHALSD
jgi:hypothetical protein